MTVYLVYHRFRKAILCPKCNRAAKMHMNKDGSLHCGYCSIKFRISSKTKLRKLEELSDVDLNWEIKSLQKIREENKKARRGVKTMEVSAMSNEERLREYIRRLAILLPYIKVEEKQYKRRR